jgi:hypothetical protein
MKTTRLKLFLIPIIFLLINQVVFAQLDPLPGDPLPGDPGIEVPIDTPILVAVLLISSVLVYLVVKKKKTTKNNLS